MNDSNITANFEPEEKQIFSLIILKNISRQESFRCRVFEEGQYVQISASSNPGFRFSHWLGNGIENPLSSQTQIFLDSDSLATASFALSELSVFLESEYLENQWFSSWLGTIYQTDTGWIYHAQLGWIYPQIRESGIWIWKETMGWLWTNNNIYLQNFIWLDRSDKLDLSGPGKLGPCEDVRLSICPVDGLARLNFGHLLNRLAPVQCAPEGNFVCIGYPSPTW